MSSPRDTDNWFAFHASQKLDLVFIVDCTWSMERYINVAKRNIESIVTEISKTAYDAQFALIQYRDHPPEDTTFVSQCHPFTSDVTTIKGLCILLFLIYMNIPIENQCEVRTTFGTRFSTDSNPLKNVSSHVSIIQKYIIYFIRFLIIKNI